MERIPNSIGVEKILSMSMMSLMRGSSAKNCGKSFAWKNGLKKHIIAEHERVKHVCKKCQKSFKNMNSKLHHERNCDGQTEHRCHICNKLCSTAHGLRRHTQVHNKEPFRKEKRTKRRVREDSPVVRPSSSTMTQPTRYHCRRCSKVFDDRSRLFLHGIQEHYNMHGGALQSRPWTSNDDAPWAGDDALRRVYEANAPLILENHRRGPIRSVFNFPLTNEVGVKQIVGFVDNIYRLQDRAFRRVNIFEKLDQYEIHVPEDERTFLCVICYDYEAILQNVQEKATEMLQWNHQHVPISVSICSNVEGHTDPICIVEGDQDQLVRKMVEHMNDIALRVYELASEKWGWVLEAINDKLRHEDGNLEWIHNDDNGDDVNEGMKDDREPKVESHPLKKVYGHMETHMTQVPVLGFNSGKYDLNVIIKCLAKHLCMHEDSYSFDVKKCNAYTCIATENLKFLDMSQYLAAGSSYAGFLKAYGLTEQKGYFCYEWFDSLEKLNYPSLPPHEDIYSQLKGCNISSDEYEYCQKVWKDQKMINFRDFLIWYNNLDVTGFVDAVEKFQKFYFDKGIDVFKTLISVPGRARQILFETAKSQNVNFALFDNHNKDLYQTIKRNIVGGPSIIFTRHHCAGKTLIRGKKLCQSVLGFDANALYLHVIDQPMPVGPFVRRLARNNFRPELRDKYMLAYYWMDWLIHNEGLNIQHKLNIGREGRAGKYPVDGYVPSSKPDEKPIVLQFQGCYWHGHLCDETGGIKDEKWHSSRKEKYRNTQETTAYLKRDHRGIEMWGCEFRKYCKPG